MFDKRWKNQLSGMQTTTCVDKELAAKVSTELLPGDGRNRRHTEGRRHTGADVPKAPEEDHHVL